MTSETRYKATLAYDGTAYSGWQVQPGADTVQERLKDALSRMAKTPVSVVGAGRTDAGVHAWGQVAHFEIPRPIPESGILRGLNAMLPPDIRVLEVAEAGSDFHARYSARGKTYRYYLDRSPVASPFRSRYTLHYPFSLDRAAVDAAARAFVGRHDFEALRAASCGAKTTEREVFLSEWRDGGSELVYEVAGDGFLQHMIRNMVGTLLEVGRGKRSPASMAELLESRNRALAGPTAAAKGLHLVRVEYPS